MSGVRSEEVRKKLLALTPFPQLEAVVALCRSEESACNTEADLSSKPALNAAVRSPALCRYCGLRSPTPLSLGLSGLREDMLALQSAPSLPSGL